MKRADGRKPYDDLFERLDRGATFVLANLLWVVLSIPLITLPLATAGLFATMSLWVRGKPPDLFPVFFGAMRHCWLTSLLIAVGDLAVGGLLLLNLMIFPLMDMSDPIAFLSRSVTVFGAVMLALVNLYAWPLMVVLDLPPRKLIEHSVSLVFAHPFASVGIAAVALLPLIISFWLPAAVFLTATASCVAYIMNWGAWRIIRRYLTDEERQKLESRY